MSTTTSALTDDQIARLDTLLNDPNVTAGPWIADDHEIHRASGDIQVEWVGETCNVDLPDTGAANAALIVAARNALPALLAEIARLRDTVAAVTAKAEEFPVLDDESAASDYDLGRRDLAETIRHIISNPAWRTALDAEPVGGA